MTRYARVQNGMVEEIVEPLKLNNRDIAVEQRYTPDLVEQMVAIPDDSPVDVGWSYAPPTGEEGSGAFAAPFVANPEPAAVTSITMRQARLALLAAGKLADVQAAIEGLSSPIKEAAQIEWEYAATVERDNALLQMLVPALNLDLDALFAQGSQL